MRISIQELKKSQFPLTVEESLDFSKSLVGFEDILDCSNCKVKEVIKMLTTDTYQIKFEISIDLTLESSISLKKIPYHISSDFEEIFSTSDDEIELSDGIKIEDNVLDTEEAILTEILTQKPMSSSLDDESFEDDEAEEYINPAFAGLDDLLKK